VCKPDGSGYRFVLALSQLLNHLDGHHSKLEKTNCALPDAEIFRSTFRKAGPGSTNSLPALSTDRIKSWVHDISCAVKMGRWSKDSSWRSMVVVVDLALAALRRHCGKREETCTKVRDSLVKCSPGPGGESQGPAHGR
jgi:hypothetical protein